MMKSEDWLIVELGAALVLFTALSFFFTPSYEKAVWFILGVLASQFANVVGYKFGKSIPQQLGDPRPGQSSSTQTEIVTKTELVDPTKPVVPPAVTQ